MTVICIRISDCSTPHHHKGDQTHLPDCGLDFHGWGNLASWYSVAHPMTSGINLVSQESERSENAVMVQGADASLPLCRNLVLWSMGWVKQKISMWVRRKCKYLHGTAHNPLPISSNRTKSTKTPHPATSPIPHTHRNLLGLYNLPLQTIAQATNSTKSRCQQGLDDQDPTVDGR
jgi:hypothetical protein